MNNADKFKLIFDLSATELWAMSEKDFLAWLNAERDVSDTNVDDLISRQAAIAEAYDVVIDGSVFKVVQVETLYGLPTIDPVKHGKWIKNEGRYGWHCSACGEDDFYAFVLDSDTGENKLQDHYCPNCGARMDG